MFIIQGSILPKQAPLCQAAKLGLGSMSQDAGDDGIRQASGFTAIYQVWVGNHLGSIMFSLCELEYGVQKSAHIQQNTMNLMRFLMPWDILPFDEPAAREHGKIRADIERVGMLRDRQEPS